MKKTLNFTFLFNLMVLFLAACGSTRSGLETITPAPAATPQKTPTQPSGTESPTRIFSSDIYHYKVSYPADWMIQVNSTAPPGAGSNPEYVTFTSNDPSGLPRIDIEVLTGAPPMVGFENCDQNFVFRNIPACKISLPAGQTPASDVWIFQNGETHYFIGMQYQGSEPVQTFADFLMSFEFTQSTTAPLPQPTKGAVYQDKADGFELIYPADWKIEPSKPIGSRASQALLLSPGTTSESLADGGSRIAIVIYSWEPTNDLNAYVTKRKDAWNASGTKIIEENDLKLTKELQAVSFTLENTDKQLEFVLITTFDEKYLEIAGQGNLTLIQEIAQTLSPMD